MLSKKNIHIVRDEKFIDSAWRDFENAAPNKNIFIIIGLKKNLQFVKKANVYFIRPRVAWILARYSHLFTYSIIFHSLGSVFEENLILRIHKNVKISWISWGYDLYPFLGEAREYLKPKTLSVFQFIYPTLPIAKENRHFSDFKRSFKNKPNPTNIFNRINFISPVIRREFDLLSDIYSIDPSKYIRWNYLNLEDDILSKDPDFVIEGNDILIGHSGSFWLNHLDALDILPCLGLEYGNIILPLSYGDKQYIKALKGELSEGTIQIKIVEYFMPYHKYISLLKSCKYLFINAKRQIAMGNILFFLYYNGVVIIDSSNPIIDTVTQLGIQTQSTRLSGFLLIRGGDQLVQNILKDFWGKCHKSILTDIFLKKNG